jgi:hypothetical protein
MAAPARITIELEPPRNRRERWRARTRVDGHLADSTLGTTAPSLVVVAPPNDVEHGEPAVTPVAYEPPGECTCVEGFCEADHERD